MEKPVSFFSWRKLRGASRCCSKHGSSWAWVRWTVGAESRADWSGRVALRDSIHSRRFGTGGQESPTGLTGFKSDQCGFEVVCLFLRISKQRLCRSGSTEAPFFVTLRLHRLSVLLFVWRSTERDVSFGAWLYDIAWERNSPCTEGRSLTSEVGTRSTRMTDAQLSDWWLRPTRSGSDRGSYRLVRKQGQIFEASFF